MRIDPEVAERITAALEAEVERRDQWYGLDNWSYTEVVEFVLEHLRQDGFARRQHDDVR